MARQSLLDYFRANARPPSEKAVVWRRGYRVSRWTYRELFQASAACCEKLRSLGLRKGDRVLLWGDNSGEWLAAFLGCLFCGAIAVPIDAIAEKGFAERVSQQAGVRVAFLDRGIHAPLPEIATIFLEEINGLANTPASAGFSPEPASRSDVVEIVFTSGTTAEPRGVVLTHGNVLANLEPIEREIERYRRYERIFHPLRFLDLLPLSHVFGQMLGVFLPQILGATTIFADSLNPSEITRTIHDEHVSVVITVPRLIESLKEYVERDVAAREETQAFQRSFAESEGQHFLNRWWTFRRVHRRFGWKFWAIISGGAALPGEAEQFWGRLGYAVIQGYGLTETTSLVSVNHPFRLGRGSIGKSLPGREVKLADDGEILVRGENVASGYWQDSRTQPVNGEDGWFHTGDLGARDAAGNLYFKSRSKNVIVTPEGLNVYPQDLEAELRKEPAVRDCIVIGLERDGNAEPCAVLLLRDSSDSQPETLLGRANARLAPFQQMRRWMIWPESDFPRTSTQKPNLGEIRRAVANYFDGSERTKPKARGQATALSELISRIQGESPVERNDGKLQLSSIERVDLLSALEDRYQIDLSETEFAEAETTDAIARLLEQPAEKAFAYHYPRWAQSWPVRMIRAIVQNVLARPAMLVLGWPKILGRENLQGITNPVLVVANHIAFFDPAYIWEALPAQLRGKLAIAMDGELLESMRNPPKGRGFFGSLADRAAYWLVVSIYNVFPLPVHAGFRRSFSFAGDLIGRGWSVLIFPEGARTRSGEMNPFRAGIGLLATQLQVPVVPMRMDGIFELGAVGKRWARPGQIKVSIGAPMQYGSGAKPEEVALDLERRVAEAGTAKHS